MFRNKWHKTTLIISFGKSSVKFWTGAFSEVCQCNWIKKQLEDFLNPINGIVPNGFVIFALFQGEGCTEKMISRKNAQIFLTLSAFMV